MKKQEIKILQKKAFTLVELIIVITILAILATIAFVSFSNYTKTSRDANRILTLGNIEKGLQTFQITTSKYPIPDEYITILDSGTTIGEQGYVGETVSNLIKASKIPTDPQDGTKYVYARNSIGKKYQLMTFLEAQNNQTAFVSKSFAADYAKRFPTVRGDSLGIFLDQENNPIKTPTINIRNHSGSTLKVVIENNKVLTGTGRQINTTLANYKFSKTWKDHDPNCDVDDIVIGDQVWAGCNSTLGDGLEWGEKYLIMNCSSYDGITGSANLNCTGEQMKSSAKESDWSAAQGKTGVQNNIWGKLYTKNNLNSVCPSGWHIATLSDWTSITTLLNNGVDCLSYYTCPQLGWSGTNDETNIVKILKIPLSGRLNATLSFAQRGNYVDYYSSGGYIALTKSSGTLSLNSAGSLTATPIRCIKD